MERRSFLKWATHGLGALFGLLLGIPAVAYLIDARNRPARQGDFKRVARLRDLEVNVPKQVVIRDVRQDAWTLHPDEVLGRVWLVRRPTEEVKKMVEAYTTICPHLGCSINFEDRSEPKRFICPCHNGTFNLEGQRVELPGVTNPAPRGMDSLECQFEDEKNPDYILVKYQNFIQSKHDKEPKK